MTEAIIILAMAIWILVLFLFYIRECNRSRYFKDLLVKILNNDDLIKESLATVAAAYNIEEGDILEFISKRSKKE